MKSTILSGFGRLAAVALLMIMMPIIAKADVEINETNFPDEAFRNYLLSQSYGKDCILTDNEIKRTKNISVIQQDIQSLKGIEYFTSLTSLECNLNQLTSLDVSKLINLTSLSCSDNQLTSLNISNLTKLTLLKCAANQLTSLDISNLTALTSLECQANQLTSLDVSNLVNLTSLKCEGNQLTSLDVSNLMNLTWLECYGNQLRLLDVSNLTKLTTLYCEINHLSSLTLSGCTSLEYISCYQNQINGAAMDALVESLPRTNNGKLCVISDQDEGNVMTTTQVKLAKAKKWTPYYLVNWNWKVYNGSDPNQEGWEINEENFPDEVFRQWLLDRNFGMDGVLTDVELKNTKVIWASGLNIQDLKGIEVFTALEELHCSENKLSTLDLSKNTKLRKLDCSINQLTSLDVTGCTELTEIHCYRNHIKGAEMDALVKRLPIVSKGNMYAIYYEDEQNVMTTDQIEAAKAKGWLPYYFSNGSWVEFVDIDPDITDVKINEENFPDEVFRQWLLDRNFGMDGVLTDVELKNINNIYVNDLSIQNLKGIEVFTALEELHCSENKLSTLDLSKNTKLRKLDCSSNLLVSLNVTGCTELTEIHCYQNHIKGAEMDALVESLPIVNNRNMYVVYDEDEHNVITTDQVKVAKAKGWLPHYCSYGLWVGYLDIDPDVTGVQINEENFPDPVFRNWLAGQEYGKDRILTNDEIQNITIMEVSNINIQNLKGVEFFTELECLYCGANSLSELDLSKNSKLKICYCEYNQLKSLDVSHNIQLEHLNCGNNPLGSIDITKNTKLMSLECYSNKLTELDLSQNTELTSINCDTNPLKEIDLSRNTALTDLKCRSTGLKALDVSMCTKLTQLFCGYNAIKALDVSKCTELTWLDCKYNKIWELDLSKNTKLMTLDCLYNRLIGEGMDALIESLPMRTNEEGAELHVYQELEDQVQNWMTTVQVAAAKAKGWKPMRSDDGFTWVEEYEGTPPAVGISINKKKFPDENFFYYVIENLPCGNDGVLTNQEIANIKVISCTGLDIKRLKGIEYFTAITTLLCYLNKIKGAAMDELIRCLPITDYAKMNVIWGDEDENVMTTTQVAAAKAKGWTPLYRDIDKIAWQAYEGSEPDLDPIVIAEETTVNPSEDAGPGKATTTESGVTTSLGAEDEVNAGEGSVTMVSSMTTNEVEELVENSLPTTPTFTETFKGFYFMLAAGKGRVEFDIETMGGYSLGIMIGSKFVGLYNKSIKGTVTIPYDIMENTWFFAYPTVSTANVRAHRASSTDGALKVYSLRIIPEDTYDPDGIGSIDNGQLIIDNSTSVYDLSGRKIDSSFFTLHSSFKRKGIYIIRMKDESSRKVLIK